jgi:hypothetical protein
VDAGQGGPLVEHVLEGTDANRQIDRLVRDAFQLSGVTHLEHKVGYPSRVPKASARQFDHARRNIDPDGASDLRCKGKQVMTIATTEIKDDVGGSGPGKASHKPEPVFEQPPRMPVLFRRSD